MNTCIYDKTDKGREEIATRKYQVPPRLRTLLVMIDGRRPLGVLEKDFAGLGLSEASVEELLRAEYITLVSNGVAANEAVLPAPRPPASAKARMQARTRAAAARAQVSDDAYLEGPDVIEAERAAEAGSEEAPDAAPTMEEAERFRALYDFYNQTVKSTLGLRGFVLQLKVEKAASVDDFRALRQAYLEAVLKARGREMALSLRDRLDQLLGGPPARDGFVLPAP